MNGPAWLAIETSVPAATVAVGDASGVWWSEEFTSDRSHNAVLFAPLERAMKRIGDARLEVVLVGTGPGSYSGTRVGIAAGQGVAIANACPAVGVPSLLATPQAALGGRSLAVGDARRGGWWAAPVEAGQIMREPTVSSHEEFAAEVAATVRAGIPVVTFDPPERLHLSADLVSRLVMAMPVAGNLIAWWAQRSQEERTRWESVPPQPVYLRPPHVTQSNPVHPLLRGSGS